MSAAEIPVPERRVIDGRPIGDESFPVWPDATLIGRGREADLVLSLIDQGERLISLTGPGGIGKTRLAVHIARRIAAGERLRVVVVPLADTHVVDDVLPALGARLDVRGLAPIPPGGPLPDDLVVELRAGPTLVMFDNAEHLTDMHLVVNMLLVQIPDLRILVTSQRRLALSSEREVPVGPLELPAATDRAGAEPRAAVRLFIQQGQRARPGLVVRSEDMPMVDEIARQLDGMPLAIELAAARLRVLDLRDLRDHLAEGLPMLGGGISDLPARQRTMADAIRWGYELLSPREQILLQRLSVFAGGFELRSAEYVCADPDDAPSPTAIGRDEVIDGLTALEHASFLVGTDTPETGRRFRLLTIIRLFARDALERRGEAEDRLRRHLEWFTRQVQRAEHELLGPGQQGWLAWLDINAANIRQAIETAFTISPKNLGVTLVGSQWRYWDVRGLLADGRAAMERALPYLDDVDAESQANLLTSLGHVVSDMGDYGLAESYYGRALAIRRLLGDQGEVAGLLNITGILLRTTGQTARARPLHLESLALRTERKETRGIGLSYLNLSQNALWDGDLSLAWTYGSQALTVLRESGDAEQVAVSQHTLACIAIELGRNQTARQLTDEAERSFVTLGSRFGVAYTRHARGRLDLLEKNLPAAATALALALDLRRDIGYVWGIVDTTEVIGQLAIAAGDTTAGARLLLLADRRRQEIGAPRSVLEAQRYESAMERLRRRLGAPRLQELVVQDELFSRDQVVEIALATANRIADQAEEPAIPAQVAVAPATGSVTDVGTAYGLTRREREILTHVAEGRTDREIADSLFLSRRTVSEHVRHILAKMEVPSRTAAAAIALRNGLV